MLLETPPTTSGELTIEPAEQRRNSPWVVAEPVPGRMHDAQFGARPGRVNQRPGILKWDDVIVGTVNHEQRAGRELRRRGDGIERGNLAFPRSLIRRKVRIRNQPDFPDVLEKAIGFADPLLQ